MPQSPYEVPQIPVNYFVDSGHESSGSIAKPEVFAMPATAGQLRFWSLDQLNPGNPAFNMPLKWDCTGPLDVAALQHAFALCVDRHEMLRTTFTLNEGKLTQLIHPTMAVLIPVVDLCQLDAAVQSVRGEELIRDHAALRLDLRQGPLLVLKLLRLDEQHHLLLVTMHHIICDGYSLGVLLRDMVAFYEALVNKSAPLLPDLPIQFADFAIWQEEWLAGKESAASLQFWRDYLGNDFSRFSLNRDLDAVSSLDERHQSVSGDIETLLIPRKLQDRAHVYCKRESITFNTLLMGVFASLLYRLTGRRDLVIGSPCANRTEETLDLIGLFTNIQVMRLQLAEEETLRSLIEKVQKWALEAFENQALPFESLIHDPYFAQSNASLELPIFFLYQKAFMITYRVGGLEIVPVRSDSPGAVFEMMFAIVDRESEGPRLQLEYNPKYFKVSTIERYLQLYVNLLESVLDAPDLRLDRFALLRGEELKTVLKSGYGRQISFGEFQPMHVTFLRLAEDSPNRIALECAGVTWSNRQLATYARKLARRLLDEGLQPEGLVGICVERSPEMIGAVLAVMIAGGAYVPMDPRHPKERLTTILADAGADFLLVSGDSHLQTDAKVINLSTLQLDGVGVLDEPVPVCKDSLVYVIYTSGSTGKPKGVAIEHGALVNLLRSMEQTPGLKGEDVLVAITTLAFDIAALELMLPLMTGAKLVIATSDEVQSGGLLLALLRTVKATVLQATPGAWRILIDAGWTNSLPLKALCGGEALPRDLANKLLERSSELWNVYGPTETTIWSSATRVTPGTGSLRIGPPIANTQFLVLDTHHEPLPAGIDGELYIGGTGLARGYWRREEMTAERFVTNPFGAGRLYATGDLARLHEDGSIELLGRIDFQVKIRGHRIELAEIEGALDRHPAVMESVVIAQNMASTGIARLTGYLAVGPMDSEAAERVIKEVEAKVRELLPDYMVPNLFVCLEALPRNTNGKIERKLMTNSLADDIAGSLNPSSANQEEHVGPHDVLESQLADIWQTTLGLSRISVRASFFSLGVGSLAGMRLITKMNRVYAMDLGLATLISASTIESIAELIRTRFAPNTSSSLVPLQPHGSRPPLYIVHGIGGNVVNFYGLSMRMGGELPVYGIQSQALVANSRALLRLKDMAAHYISDIRKVQPKGPYHLLGYSFGGTVVFEMAQQLKAMGDEVRMLGMIDSKCKDYGETLAKMSPVQERISKRVIRFRGNTGGLSRKAQLKYVFAKLNTRAIRYACLVASKLHLISVPAFMRSAYDINYVAVQNYVPQPYDGKLILFRASEQDDSRGPYDLGWGYLFSKGVEIYDLTGDHERIFLEPNIDLLASSLRDCLVRV